MNDKVKVQWTPLPATIEDAESMAECNYHAFTLANDPAHCLLFPADRAHLSTEQELREYRVKRVRLGFAESDASSKFKIVDPNDSRRVIAYARWLPPGHFANKSLKSKADEEPMPAAIDAGAFDKFYEVLDKERDELWRGDANYWYLAGLAVHPDFQRRGIANALLQFGLDQSKKDQVPIYLEGTKAGLPVYQKLGFKFIKQVDLFEGRASVALCIRDVVGDE